MVNGAGPRSATRHRALIGVDSKNKRCKAEHVGLAGAAHVPNMFTFSITHFALIYKKMPSLYQKHARSGLGAEAQRKACGEECADDRHGFAGLLRFGALCVWF